MSARATYVPLFRNTYTFRCQRCGREVKVSADAKIKASIFLHWHGWRSSSVDSRHASHCCEKCVPACVDLKVSAFASAGRRMGAWA